MHIDTNNSSQSLKISQNTNTINNSVETNQFSHFQLQNKPGQQ